MSYLYIFTDAPHRRIKAYYRGRPQDLRWFPVVCSKNVAERVRKTILAFSKDAKFSTCSVKKKKDAPKRKSDITEHDFIPISNK